MKPAEPAALLLISGGGRALPPIGTPVSRLPTPCLLLDHEVLMANLRSMQDFVSARGKTLRAHAKTHKCSRLAALQCGLGASGICAAKVSEAHGLIANGIRNVLLTGPAVTPLAHEALLECAEADPGFIATLDNMENASRLSSLFHDHGRRLRCLIDLDLQFGRTGIPADRLADFFEALRALPGLEVLGLQAYAGHIQHIAGYEQRRDANRVCLDIAAAARAFLRERGLSSPILSVGGTGSFDFDTAHPEVTEIQAGSYALMDAEYFQIGGKNRPRFEDFAPALSLLTTVVSANQPGFVTVDAGLKALYRDGATPEVCRLGLAYDWFGDEYGKVYSPSSAPLPALGEQLRLIVSHCDPTVNLFDRFFVIQDDHVSDIWPIDLRGRSQ